ncbi:MAG: helix-turn-helix transcriptional regulator, partial [Clostridium sp.]
ELQAIFAGLSGIDSISSNIHTNNIYDKFSSDKNSVIANSGNVLIDLSSHYKKSLTEKIELIKVAINEQNLISFKYFYSKGEANKTIEPYLIVFKWSSWYVFGYCLERNDFRLFKLNRLLNLKFKKEYFNERVVPSEVIDFNKYFANEIKLTALFNSKVKYRLIEEYGIDSFTTLENDKLKLEVGFESHENLLSWVLSFGDLIEVIEPKEVCLELKRQAEMVFKRY